ncbi:hypothetical protein OROGR_005041 [Orobanche gracilis]
MSTALASVRKTLFEKMNLAQGDLEAEQFDLLEDLQDDETPNFAEDAVNTFYKNSTKQIKHIAEALKKKHLDFEQLGYLISGIDGTRQNKQHTLGRSRMFSKCLRALVAGFLNESLYHI